MVMTWIKVVREDDDGEGDDFFMDGNFVDKAGKIGKPLRADSGQHTFVVVDADFNPLWRKRKTIKRPDDNTKDDPVIVTLEQV